MDNDSRGDKDLCPDELHPISAVEKGEEIGDIHFDASNFSGALDYFAKAKQSALALSHYAKAAYLDLKIASCYKAKGDLDRAIEHTVLAKEAFRKENDLLGLARAYCLDGVLHAEIGRYGRGRRLCETGQRLLKGTGEFLELGKVQNWLGFIHTRLGDVSKARECFEGALFAFRNVKDDDGISQALNNLGILHKNLSEWREAAGFFEKALAMSEKSGNFARMATYSLNLGIVHFRLGQWGLALRELSRSSEICVQTGNKAGAARAKLATANISLRKREWATAETLYRDVLAASRELNLKREEVLALEFMGELELAKGNSDGALDLLKEAEAIATEIAPKGDLVMEVTRRAAEAHMFRGEIDDALRAAERAIDIARSTGDRCEEALARRVIGIALCHKGEWEQGCQTIDGVVSTLVSICERFEVARTFLASGRAIVSRLPENGVSPELSDKAVSLLRQAMGVFLGFEVKGWAALATVELAQFYLKKGMPDESLNYIDEAEKLLSGSEEPEIHSALAGVRASLEKAFVSSTLSSSSEFKILGKLGRLLGGEENPERTLDEFMQLILARSDADRGLIALVAEGAEPHIWAVKGLSSREALGIIGSLREAFAAEMAGGPRVVTSIRSDKTLSQLPALERVQSFALVPLNLPSGQKGIVYVDRLVGNRLGAFKQRELNLIAVMSGMATLAAVEAERVVRMRENAARRQKLDFTCSFDGIVTQNKEMLEILSLVEKVGSSSATILIQGETGTGKALVAEAIHGCSPRKDKPFVSITCSAIPESLLESELFGHVQGAFTGAIRDKKGLFEEAEAGTVFLDEVAKTSKSIQAKLLHFLDKKEIRAVGSNKWKQVDSRIICATNTDLKAMIKEGEFLEDLYYRLSDITISVPSLRERRDDIPVLVEHFLRVFGAQGDKPVRGVTRGAMQLLMDYDWPGNVRELEKTVKRMLVLAPPSGELGVDLLPPEIRELKTDEVGTGALRTEVEKTERRVISEALDRHGWNKARAARSLNISYPTLLKKIVELDLDRRHNSK